MKPAFTMPAVIPYHAQWDITSGCNHRCVFCLTASGQRGPNELSTAEAKSLIDKLYDEGIWFLKIMGGEPFFRKDTPALFRYAVSKGMILSFSTNASLINEEIASTLGEIRNSILYIQMSLYGDNQETYQAITGSAHNFERALHGLKLLIENDLDVSVLTVATAGNAHKLGKYYDIAASYGAKEFRLAPEISLGRAADKLNHKTVQAPQIWGALIRSLNVIKDSLGQNGTMVLLDARPLFGTFLHKITGFRSYYENCTAATTMLYIDPAGESLPCPFLRQMPEELKERYRHIASQNIMKQTFHEVWESESFNLFRSYYDPQNNLFTINEKCKYFRNGACTPCTVTPCNCTDMIRAVKNEIAQQELSG